MTNDNFIVTPWEVVGDVNYDVLMERFGTQKIDPSILDRVSKHTGELHFMLRRGIFYSHRDFDRILNAYEKKDEFVLYTGRGPSGNTHLGHLMPWIFTKYIQDKYDAKLLFQLTDDEKFLFNRNLTQHDTRKYAYENILDIIAVGFNPKKTEIFLDTDYIKTLYEIALDVSKRITLSTAKAVFGFNNSTNIGRIFFTSIQSVPAFLESKRQQKSIPCLIPCAIDQDPHFRVTRDVASALNYPKPALIHCKFFPSLTGSDKMSASKSNTSIFTTDSPKIAEKKIMNAITGGRKTVKKQRKNGGNPSECSIYQYYYYLFEDKDEKVIMLSEDCKDGQIICGECKQILAEKVKKFLVKHQEKREKAKDVVDQFMCKD